MNMENSNANHPLFTLRITENTRIQLRGAAIVAGISAILSLAGAVIGLINSFLERNRTTFEYRFEGFDTPATAAERTESIGGAIVTFIISLLLFYFLNKFSRKTKLGLDTNDQQLVTSGLGALSSYFTTIGILLIIGIVLGLLVLAIAIPSM
jgi:divalent metal cation (Fe/Co/Zn/Cd) transporter